MLYDLFLEILHTVWKNGLGLTALGTVVYVLLKQRRVKKRLKKYFPWLLEDESETKHYIENQKRIEYKVDLLLKERGITWHAPTSEMLKSSTKDHKTSYISSSAVVSAVRGVARPVMWLFIKFNTRRIKMSKLKSRKFWMAVVSAVLVVLNEGLDLGISSETVLTFAGLVATFILGESVIDAKRAGSKDDFTGDTGPAE